MSSERLFTPRFFVMCGFTFTVFLSAFQLLPTAAAGREACYRTLRPTVPFPTGAGTLAVAGAYRVG